MMATRHLLQMFRFCVWARAFAATLAVVLSAQPCAAEKARLRILLASDIYKTNEADGRGGYPRLAAVVQSERAKHQNLIYVHAGDALSPCLMCAFDKGEQLWTLTNMVPPDFFVPGNHEFDFGREMFLTRMSEAKFPLLAANLRLENGNIVPGFADSALKTFGPVKIGFIGLTAEDSAAKSNPGTLKISPAAEALDREARALRAAGAHLIVAISHANRAADDAILRTGLADVLLSGDDHDLKWSYDGKTIFAESGEDARFITALDLDIDVMAADPKAADSRSKVRWTPALTIIDTKDVTPDPTMVQRVKAMDDALSTELDVALGTLDVALDSTSAAMRTRETALGNFVADAIRAATKTDIALLNGGTIRGNRTYPAGAVLTRRDVLTEMPFGNRIVAVEITGADLRSVLEHAVASYPNPSGGFMHASGLRYVFNPQADAGTRIVSVTVGQTPLSANRKYTLAINEFLARGGDGYAVFAKLKQLVRAEDGDLITNIVMSHARALGKIAPQIDGRIQSSSP